MARARQLRSLEDYSRALRNRYGVGEGIEYKPWIRVQDVPSKGLSAKIQGIKHSRPHHLLSEQETTFFYLAEFSSSVIDLREQFPLLPLSLSLKIAHTLGIKHPAVPTTKTPIVMTTDFVLTRTDGASKWYEAISVKPASELSDKRTAEKLEIERLWWTLLGVPFHIFTVTAENLQQSQNIQWITADYRRGKKFSIDVLHCALEFISEGVQMKKQLCQLIEDRLNLPNGEGLLLLKELIVRRLVSVDLSSPLERNNFITIISINATDMVNQYASGN